MGLFDHQETSRLLAGLARKLKAWPLARYAKSGRSRENHSKQLMLPMPGQKACRLLRIFAGLHEEFWQDGEVGVHGMVLGRTLQLQLWLWLIT